MGCLLPLTMRASADAGEIQPDRLNFGIVHVAAKVQGSVRIFVDPEELKSGKAKVTAPAFVKVDSVNQGTQEYGPGNRKGYCDIAVTIDTANPGKVSSPIVMSLGKRRVEVPVSADIRPRKPVLPRILVADTPFQKFSTGDAKLFDPWLKLVEAGGFDVDYVDVRSAKSALDGVELSQYDTVLLGEMGLIRLNAEDIAALRRYAQNGGRVILAANAFFMGTVENANKILIPSGLEIRNVEMPNVGAIEVGAANITPCPQTDGVKALSFHRPSPGVVIDHDRTLVLVSSPKNPDEHFVALASTGKGQVVSLGVSLWWSWVGKADNAALLENLLRRKPRKG
ncbi:MAG: hypothetical protein P4L84_05355 [Isosphaeraceae bacterium]|nr:hypothetical protein [Isosphaeraceae bacterium]